MSDRENAPLGNSRSADNSRPLSVVAVPTLTESVFIATMRPDTDAGSAGAAGSAVNGNTAASSLPRTPAPR
ncbi:Uncharacterised protein [Mycobacteroides abscessus subsp. abscessus]|nr:Uncharacterised protein [Mycobacteroides abscessus subsp. abscessus]